MEQKENRVGLWEGIAGVLAYALAFLIPFLIGDAWITFIIGTVLGVASFLTLFFFVDRVLRKNSSINRKIIRFLIIVIWGLLLSLALLAKLVLSLLMDLPRII